MAKTREKNVLILLLLLLAASAQAQQATGPGARSVEAGVGFGGAVALSGDEAFIGEPSNVLGPGAAYVFARDPSTGVWTERQRLTASDGTFADGFGRSLAVEGEVLIVGADAQDDARGAAYVFRKAPATGRWVEEARLTAEDAASGHRLGNAVALRGDVALVGASSSNTNTGAAYVFRYEAATGAWRQEARLIGSDSTPDDFFGVGLALVENEALVGAHWHDALAGAVYVFERDVGTGQWNETAMFTGNDTDKENLFGEILALQGDELIVGAPKHASTGAVYAFRKNETGDWEQQEKLVGSGLESGDRFGRAVAVAGDALWIGAPFADNFAGTVYAYQRESASSGWVEQETMVGSQIGPFGAYGEVVALDGSYALGGSDSEDFGTGAAYVFKQDTLSGSWTEQARVIGSDEGPEAIIGASVACAAGVAAFFPCGDVDLMAFLPTREMGGARGSRTNDLWGWTDPQTGREYALVGRIDGTSFVDVSDPINPVVLGDLPTHTVAATWRDIKVYANHAFIVADGAGDHGMQLFDLTQLRTVENPPVIFEETAHYDGIASAHNIAINEATGFAYAVGANSGGATCGGGLHMIDIQDPLQPTFAGCFSDPLTGRGGTGYTHDVQCVVYRGPDAEHQGKEICFGSNETALSIADVTDKRAPVALAAATYPTVGYAHQGWLTDDHRYFFLDDELDEFREQFFTRTIIWDLADLDDPQLLAEHTGTTGAIDHNQYVVGDYLFQSNYASGLRILDISDVANPVEVAFFDVFPANDATTFRGTWSNYPFFDSGVVLVSGREAGLFIVKPSAIIVAAETSEAPEAFALAPAYPNPFNPTTTLTLTLPQAQDVTVTAYDVLGRAVAVLHRGRLAAGAHQLTFGAAGLPGGTYFVRAEASSSSQVQVVTLVK